MNTLMNILRKKSVKPIDKKKRIHFKLKQPKFLNNMRLAPKLLAGFFIITLMGASMGIFSSVNMDMAMAANTKIYEEMLLPQRNISNITNTFQQTRIDFRNLILMDNASMERNIPSLKSKLNWMESSIDSVETLMPQESKEYIESFRTAIGKYSQKIDSSLEALKTGGHNAITDDLINGGELYNFERSVTDALDKLNTISTKEANTQQTDSKKTAENVKLIIFIIIGVQLIVSTTIAIFIASSISKPVKKLTKDAKLLAAGDTGITLSDKTSKDEIGQMEESFKNIVSAIQTLEQDTDMLITAVKKGELSVRADERQHAGTYRKIVEGVNITLDAMIAPINESAEVLGALSKGNLEASVQGNFEGDFAIIKNALNSTIQTLKGYIGEVTSVMNDISQGVLTASIDSEFKGDFAALKDAINKSIDAFNSVLKDINTAAEEVAQGAVQLSGGSQTISQGAAEQASAIEQLTATVTEIAEQTKNNAQSANEASDLSQKAKVDAVGGNEKMHMLQNAIVEINASSASISKIIKAIDDIAFQTNILALNAAVEAARAGAHGKGFAVVAEEVRNLAGRSAKAAQETADLIEGSISKTAAGTKIADQAAASLADIVEGVEKTVTLSGHIATASNEQATGISQVNKGIEQLSQVVQSSSATAQEAAASSEELAAQADQLKQMVSRFQLKDESASEQPKPAQTPKTDSEPISPSESDTIVLNDDDFGKF